MLDFSVGFYKFETLTCFWNYLIKTGKKIGLSGMVVQKTIRIAHRKMEALYLLG
jgi:hypothetical protein